MQKQPQLISLPNVFEEFKSLKEVHDIKTRVLQKWKAMKERRQHCCRTTSCGSTPPSPLYPEVQVRHLHGL